MKKWFYILREMAHFFFVAIPIFLLVMGMVYVGFFFYDAYKLIKKSYAKIF